MAELILKTEIKREPKALYYCGTTEDGCLAIYKCTGKKGRPKKTETKVEASQ